MIDRIADGELQACAKLQRRLELAERALEISETKRALLRWYFVLFLIALVPAAARGWLFAFREFSEAWTALSSARTGAHWEFPEYEGNLTLSPDQTLTNKTLSVDSISTLPSVATVTSRRTWTLPNATVDLIQAPIALFEVYEDGGLVIGGFRIR